MDGKITFRFARKSDAGLVLKFIKLLAEYENMGDDVSANQELLEDWMFDREKAEAVFAEVDGKPVGMALFFYKFSTPIGKCGIYMEDLFVMQEYRGRGIGKALMQKLASVAAERGCDRLEWSCMNWNKPSIDFYLSLGATPLTPWTMYRLEGGELDMLAGSKDGN